jgi:aryl-alcohol dehydrogenase-like predicted oxidoreductase
VGDQVRGQAELVRDLAEGGVDPGRARNASDRSTITAVHSVRIPATAITEAYVERMEYRMLGRSGCAVSALCLGTMTFGAESDETVSHQQLDRFVEAGGTFVDTADVYAKGESERIIGRWFASRPADLTDRVVLATKGRFPTADEPNGLGLSTRHLTRALDASLTRLGVGSIDLYQGHAFDPLTPLDETLRTMDGFIRSGKIRYYGFSNFTGWQLTKAVHLARELGLAVPVTLQPQYSLLVREIEWEIVPAAQDAGLGLLPWSPLGGGWLTGKYRRDQRPTGATRLGDNPERGMEAWDRRGTGRTWDVIDVVQRIAEARGVSMAEVALAWVTDRPAVTSTILGARTLDQLEANLRAAGLHLRPEETRALDEASDPGPPDYPYGALGVDQRSRTR